jgi:hypothetical protein
LATVPKRTSNRPAKHVISLAKKRGHSPRLAVWVDGSGGQPGQQLPHWAGISPTIGRSPRWVEQATLPRRWLTAHRQVQCQVGHNHKMNLLVRLCTNAIRCSTTAALQPHCSQAGERDSICQQQQQQQAERRVARQPPTEPPTEYSTAEYVGGKFPNGGFPAKYLHTTFRAHFLRIICLWHLLVRRCWQAG